MAQTTLNVRMDCELKQEFERFCNEIGMTMTTAVNVFAKKAVRECRIPFEIGVERPNRETLEAFEEVRKMKDNRQLGKSYASAQSMMKDILGK